LPLTNWMAGMELWQDTQSPVEVTFSEDESLIYAEEGPKNMALFRLALLNLIKAHPLKTVLRLK
jgi:hypothetical protein